MGEGRESRLRAKMQSRDAAAVPVRNSRRVMKKPKESSDLMTGGLFSKPPRQSTLNVQAKKQLSPAVVPQGMGGS